MFEASGVEPILSQARERERDYDWLGAVEFYEKALGSIPETDFLRLGEIQERIGYALYRAAMQAENEDQFKERMLETVENYRKTEEFYIRLSEPTRQPRIFRCEAMIAYIGYWLASEPIEKRSILDKCWQQTKKALESFEKAGEAFEYGKTYNQLSSSAFHRAVLEWNFQVYEKTVKEALQCGEQVIILLFNVNDTPELVKAYVKTALYLNVFASNLVSDMDMKISYDQRSLAYWQKAMGLSEEAALLELLSMSGESLSMSIDECITLYEKALACATKTGDKYLIGTALDWLAYCNFWKAGSIEDPEKRVEITEKALQHAEDAKHQLSSISYVSCRGGVLWTGAPRAEYYWNLAFSETDLRKRSELLEKAIVDGTHAIEQAENAGYPLIISDTNHVLSKALGFLAQIETDIEEKRSLLEKALKHRNESIKITEQLSPFFYWNRGVMWNYLSELKAELSNDEKNLESKRSLLEEAISNKECCLQLCSKHASYWEKTGELSYFSALGGYQYSYGELLNRLRTLTNNNEHQKRAIRAFEQAVESFQKQNLASLVGQCYWKIAKGYDTLGDHSKAAENFDLASNNYKSAAEKIPQLKDFYQDHALYMKAWSEIEKARCHHAKQEYGAAKEHYETAATVHKSLKRWSYLAPNYSAWTQIENAEDLSRKDQSEEAVKAFEQATKLFTETKKSLQTELSKIQDLDEKTMATNLIKATDLRHKYCLGRIALEEAKILDKKGDHYSSSEKYGSATEIFDRITQMLELEQDRRELKLILTPSQAWQKMTRAETEASPILYMEASQLFEEAKEFSPNEQAKMLALGHSRFCRALEAGTRFADTSDATLYNTAVQQLESASKYYVKAGFENASEYAKATELLFDAYVQMNNAKTETDQEKKARLYIMSEKVLHSSADSFMKAGHSEKREQVLRMLQKVKEERELAVSLSEVMHAPSIVSTTVAFVTPTPTHENAVGLERFEHADVQANVIPSQKNLKVGENLDIDIEFVNAGKGPALLMKVIEVVPKGFALTEKPEMYRVEDNFLNMKGKRLDPLKTEEVRLVLKPKTQGTFRLKPRILYLDEKGKYKSHEPEPTTITVKELGISGWLKGPEKAK